jgi:hypothetical protein
MTGFQPEKLLRALAEHEVEFCVIGAVAAWLQGNPSVTLDLDVMPRRDLENAERLAAALNALEDFTVRVITIDEVIASKEKLGRPKDTAALPALWATREALRRKRESTG